MFPVALHPDGTEVHAFRTPDGENFWVHEHPDRTLHINVSQLRGSGNGQYVYQAVHDFAVHNKKVFNADSAGLTDESLIRRTTNMLNAVIRQRARNILEQEYRDGRISKKNLHRYQIWKRCPLKNALNWLNLTLH